MGIFDRLFKPNVKRLKEEKNVKGLIKALRHKLVMFDGKQQRLLEG